MKYEGKVYMYKGNALKAGLKHNLNVVREYVLKRNNLNEMVRIYQYVLVKKELIVEVIKDKDNFKEVTVKEV
jgi:hypothetical protein